MRSKSRRLAVPTCVAEFQGAGSDDEIPEWQIHSSSGFFPADARNDLSGRVRHGMHGDRGFEFVEERPSVLTDFRSVGAIDFVPDFGDGQRAENDARLLRWSFERFRSPVGCQVPAFRRNQEAGMED